MKYFQIITICLGLFVLFPIIAAESDQSKDRSVQWRSGSVVNGIVLAAKKSTRHYKPKGGGRVFVFSPRRLRWYAYQNGRLIKTGRASGGAGYCRDIKRSCRTPRGVFHITRKGGANCRSGTYPKPRGGARMDYCMFFSKYYAIHGSNNVPGYNASHGCIRVLPGAARWLNRSFLRYGDKVIVSSY